MRKQLVIFAPIVLWPVHFETDLEVARQHLDSGWQVTFLRCLGTLPICALNTSHRRNVCRMCTSRFDNGIIWLGKECVTVNDFYLLTDDQLRTVADLSKTSFTSIAQLRAYALDGAEIGLAVLVSIVSHLREPAPDLLRHQKLLRDYMQSAAIAYFSIKNHLARLGADKFVVFNGRFAELRTALLAARSLGIETLVHERGGVLDRYFLTLNSSPSDIAAMKQSIERTFSESSLAESEITAIATRWYEERWQHKEQNWYSFTEHQRHGLLPDFASDRLNLVIFNSSEDEMVSYDEWRNPYYSDQNEAIRRVVADLGADGRFRIFLRVHPNLGMVNNSQTQGIISLEADFPELNVITADSQISTYGVIDFCDLVLVFGSTVGIEAAYAGKPVFFMGRSYYEDLGCCINPTSHEDLIRLLRLYASGDRGMLPARDEVRRGAVKYGFFQVVCGQTYDYVRPCTVAKSVLVRDGHETMLYPSITSVMLEKFISLFRVLYFLFNTSKREDRTRIMLVQNLKRKLGLS